MHRIWKNKSSKDVSIATYSFLLFGVAVLLIYGLLLNDTPLIIGNSAGVITTALVIVFWFKYGRSILKIIPTKLKFNNSPHHGIFFFAQIYLIALNTITSLFLNPLSRITSLTNISLNGM